MASASKKTPVIVAVIALGVLVTDGVLSYRNTLRLADTDARVARTYAILRTLEETMSSLKDAETGQRGYVITGDRDYLTPYESALRKVPEHIADLRSQTDDNPDQQARIARLEEKANAKLKELRHTVELRGEPGGFDAAREVIVTDVGRHLMQDIRQVAAEMEQAENDLLQQRKQDAARSLGTAKLTNLIGVLVGVTMVGLAYYLVVRDRTVELTRTNRALRGEVEQRRQAEAKVQAFADELQRSNRELQEFAAVASHDLQEPLRKIQAFGDRLQSKCAPELGEAGRDYLGRMHAAAARMGTLISDLLTYSRVATRGQPFAPVDLGRVAHEVLGDLEGRLQQTQGSVEVGPLPAVEADPTQMRQLLQNLLGNALKFRKPDVPPVVHLEGRLFDGDNGDGGCQITVSDNGIGFEEVYLDRIFGFFQRLHGRNEYEGTGMGLAICRRIVERHGGKITARSTPGEGSAFIVTLPRTQPKETTASEQAPQAHHDPDGGR